MQGSERDSVFEEIQGFFRNGPVVILGSGASIACGSFVGVEFPSMAELGAVLREEIPRRVSSGVGIGEWGKCAGELERLGLEGALEQVAPRDPMLLEAIAEVVAEVVGRADEQLRELAAAGGLLRVGVRRLLKYLVDSRPASSPRVDVVTSNYDHFVEYCCDLEQIPCQTGFQGVCVRRFISDGRQRGITERHVRIFHGRPRAVPRMTGHVQLCKPHGSLNWFETREGLLEVWPGCKCGKRVVVAPGNTKYRQVLTSNVLDLQREAANAAIRGASGVFAYGYGFSDDHLQTALVARLSEGMPMLVMAKRLTPAAKSLIGEHERVFGIEEDGLDDARSIWSTCGERVGLDGRLWFLEECIATVLRL